ncbi:SDR family oxidoreductase [Streptomyces sp. NPDC000678]|uniref:SDR family NAD(P)-dependent oxidoreductase n=1 Tax=Streptomyces sp. NPDC000678 TaxID=3154268 RepID=UPI0033187A83
MWWDDLRHECTQGLAADPLARPHRRGTDLRRSVLRVGAPGLADYSATKSGIERYTMGVARDLGPRNITANVVEAGLMEGGMQPPDSETLKALVSSLSLQRMGHPDEIAAAIAFLVSPAASYVTGAVLDAHGGYNA